MRLPAYKFLARGLVGLVGAVTLLAVTGVPEEPVDIEALGGDLTSDLPGRNAIQVNAPNVTDPDRRSRQLAGFSVFHRFNTQDTGLGPRFINAACSGCHVDNGRGPAKFTKSNLLGSMMVVKISLPGLNEDGSPRDIPGIGGQILDHSIAGRRKMRATLEWEKVTGTYPDGTAFTLRKPKLSYTIRKVNTRKFIHSLRMTPAVIGPGLLESIPDEAILALSDPTDDDQDGISGHPNFVPNVRTAGTSIGRFGFKASHPTVEQQSAAALFNDMRITNPLFNDVEGDPELSEEELDILTIYQKIAGVPRASNQDDPDVIAGKILFEQVDCAKCHRMTMNSGDYIDPELSNQEFHPFTDLLLHNMGRGLADKRAEFSARGNEWRTTPLWALGFTRRLAGGKTVYLHDGRARSPEEAILWHGGEASTSRNKFKALTSAERAQLLLFLDSL